MVESNRMTDRDIYIHWKQARKQGRQLKILSELNGLPVVRIKEIVAAEAAKDREEIEMTKEQYAKLTEEEKAEYRTRQKEYTQRYLAKKKGAPAKKSAPAKKPEPEKVPEPVPEKLPAPAPHKDQAEELLILHALEHFGEDLQDTIEEMEARVEMLQDQLEESKEKLRRMKDDLKRVDTMVETRKGEMANVEEV